FRTSVEETADVVETGREPESEVEPEGGTEWLPCLDTTSPDERLLLCEQRKWFLEMETAPGEDTMEVVGMATEGVEYHLNSIVKALAGSQTTNSKFERSSPVLKVLPNSIARYREIVHEKKSQSVLKISSFYGKNLPRHSSLREPPLTSQHPSTSRQHCLPAE
ncbi:TIGD1 protein, partial [Crocuta crocuta]